MRLPASLKHYHKQIAELQLITLCELICILSIKTLRW